MLKANNDITPVDLNKTIEYITQIFTQNMKDLIVIKWSDRFFENVVNDIFGKYKKIKYFFFIIFSLCYH